MGNQREIRQTEPRQGLGAVLRVRHSHVQEASSLVEPQQGRYYVYFQPAGGPVSYPNLDGPEVDLGVLPGDHIVIQSGGKMWCGYENFIESIRELAPHLEDGVFYVGDEGDYIDEFRIQDGRLHYRRVHEGGWWAVDDFLRSTKGIFT